MNSPAPTVKLKEVLTVSIDAVPVDTAQTYMFAGVYSFGRGLFHRGPLNGSDTTYKVFHRLHENQFVMSQVKGWEGALARVTKEFSGYFLSPVYPTFVADDERLDVRYLEFYFLQAKTWAMLERMSKGIGARRNSVYPDMLLSIEIPLPPLDEQRRIVAKIERLAGKLNQVQRLRAMSSLALSRFVNAQHVDLSSERNVALHDILVLDEDRIAVTAGFTYPQVGVRAFGQGLFPKAPVDASGTTYKSFNRLYDGAVVLSQVKGWEGAVAVCGTELAGWFVSPEYRTFRCIPGAAEPRYLRHVMATEWFWSQLKNLSRGLGGRRERTRPEQLLQLVIPMPTFEVQVKTAALFEKLEPVRGIQRQTATEIANLLPPILERAFNGEL